MKEINIGQILIRHRHNRGITQDQLAEYIGVSKASVSKWETGTTYPDITLLPRLAAFFNISIDDLMGYEPQMTKEEIRKEYQRLSAAFSSLPFGKVMEQCREIVNKYYSFPPLLFQIGALYVNHCMLAGSPRETSKVLEEAKKLFVRAREESNDLELSRQALNMEALCLLHLGRIDEAINLLKPLEMSLASPAPVLAMAYQAAGNTQEAQKILQARIYSSVVDLLSYLGTYLQLCGEDRDAFEETFRRITGVVDAFQIETLHPGILITLYLYAAQGFMALNDTQKAVSLLEKYTSLAVVSTYPLKLHGDSYFHLLDDWLESALPLGGDMPRDERIVRKSMAEAVADNPLFLPLADDLRFRDIVRRLKAMQPSAGPSAKEQEDTAL